MQRTAFSSPLSSLPECLQSPGAAAEGKALSAQADPVTLATNLNPRDTWQAFNKELRGLRFPHAENLAPL